MTTSPTSRTVLVLDDDAVQRMVLSAELREAGFAVLEAADPPQALAYLDLHEDIVAAALDVNLGARQTGLDVAAAIRRLRPGLPVVFVTGNADAAAAWTGAGPELVLPKPSGADVVVRELGRLLGR